MRPAGDARRVRDLADEGWNASEIARLTGIPRSTVRDWLRRRVHVELPERCCVCGHECHAFERLPGREYAYLLAMYLGDGVISRMGRTYRLRVATDSRYSSIIAECAAAMRAVMPTSRASVQPRRGGGYVEIAAYSNAWPCLFPQHGPGPKHARPTELAPWQTSIVDRHPEAFLRGLIHSDGCRVLNRVNGKDYPRYFFTQVSSDIRELFCRSCRQLGIHYTSSRPGRDVSVARAASVALMDGFVGPKS